MAFQFDRISRPQATKTALALTLAFGALAASAAPNSTAAASADGITCSIHVSEQAGQTVLEAAVVSGSAIDGSYALVVTQSGSGGNANIDQGGAFHATAGRETSLGTVMLQGTAGRFKAHLTVNAAGAVSCRKAASGAL